MDKNEIKGRLHRFSAIFILCFLAFPFYVSAQDGNCDDKNPCTDDMPGYNSSCIHTPVNCDDGNPCTSDSCDGTGCANIPIDCDDGDPNTVDFCNETGCVHLQTNHFQTNCNSCSTERADYGDDALDGDGSDDLDYTNNTSGIVEGVSSYALMSCDDGNPCTNDTSDGINCIHEPVNCDDGSPCTDDLCNETGCVHILVACDDGNPCTDDICNSTGCHHTARVCDDGRPCTTDSCDPVKGCINITKNCDDGKPCTDDSCDGSGNCLHAPKGCSDEDACTIDFCDREGRCIHMQRSCDDHNPCTVDYCDSAWGCEHTPVICDGGKVCIDGTCRYPPGYQSYQSPYSAPGSYIVPSGTVLSLPWGSEVTALGSMKVENAVVSAPELSRGAP